MRLALIAIVLVGGALAKRIVHAANPEGVDPKSAESKDAAPKDVEIAARLLLEAHKALKNGDREEALRLAGRSIERDPQFARSRLFRGMLHEEAARHEEAVADFTKAIELDEKLADAYHHRGCEQFKLGKIEESIADFDHYIDLDPNKAREHWQRGISYYYAGKYQQGSRQFERYQSYDDNDVENAVWRYLCMARAESVAAAQEALLPIKEDTRVPMMDVYKMFQGKLKPADVLAVAKARPPNEEALNRRLFYAHLYIGLYYESEGNAEKAREHLKIAAEEHKIEHYMWDVARVHFNRLESPAPAAKDPK